jgi:hypothetical protein
VELADSIQASRLESFLPAHYGEVIASGEAAPARIGVAIPVFGRPGYLRRCLDSLRQSHLEDCVVCLIDESCADQTPQPLPGFIGLAGVDSPGGDLDPLSHRSLEELAQLCAGDPQCLAFNTAGARKSCLHWRPFTRPGLNLYVRQERLSGLWGGLCACLRPRPDRRASQVVREWQPGGLRLVKIFKRRHGSMFDSYATAWHLLSQAYGCELLMALDSDVVVKRDWVARLVQLYEQEHRQGQQPLIVSGFHASSNPSLEDRGSFRVKQSLGGLNLMFDREVWRSLVEPCLINLEWDQELSRRMREVGGLMLACKPSVVQHIGRFGTWSRPFRYDRAADF